jgi:hypothetical protein
MLIIIEYDFQGGLQTQSPPKNDNALLTGRFRLIERRNIVKNGGSSMLNLEELKERRELVAQFDWDMTPETAVETYLEWGTGWARKDSYVRTADQESYYFVIYDWEKPIQVTLVRQDTQGLDEIAKIQAPAELIQKAIHEAGRKPGVGVYAINDDLKAWLKDALNC